MTIIIFILVLGAIIFVHELGHFLFAKLMGVYVYEFSLGMGPRLLHKKGKETEYCLRLIPIGGFCSMAGEEVDEEKIKVPKKRRLQAKKPWQRFLIMFFGPGFNFIFAIFTLFFVALIWGSPNYEPVVSNVTKNYPAYQVGIEKNDIIKKINNHKISTLDDVSLYLTIANPKKETTIRVKKENGITKTYHIKPKKITEKGTTSYKYGIGLNSEKKYGFLNSIKYTYIKTGSLFKQMWITIQCLFTGGIKIQQLSGPVGIYSIVGEQSKAGIASILYLMAFLSINVGFINLLPLPAFDGGHILFIIIEKIKGSPVSQKTENMIHTIGLFLLMALMVYITFNDILKLF
ncbi:MAG: RIP metalloprotease RseP [Bacilli bacterium]|nr:RIP metalloprotease RseP [Bacilli bacterium]